MQNKKLENQIEFLLSAALRKCGNIHDAEDLAQETLLCALAYTLFGNKINDLRARLLTVLDHKWNDHMRRKYRQPTVGIGQGFDIADEHEFFSDLEKNEEARNIRRSIAYLAGIYREVIVRHYMNGESIADISSALGIPEGRSNADCTPQENR